MNRARPSQRGFTLIELLIVVAVLGILIAVAVPLYNDQVRKTRRAAAKAEVLDGVQAKERFHTLNGTYVGSPCPPNGAYYDFACDADGATFFRILAIPSGSQAADLVCGTLEINSRGQKTVTGTGDEDDCW